jgi:hypothetical protein
VRPAFSVFVKVDNATTPESNVNVSMGLANAGLFTCYTLTVTEDLIPLIRNGSAGANGADISVNYVNCSIKDDFSISCGYGDTNLDANFTNFLSSFNFTQYWVGMVIEYFGAHL